MLVKVKHIGFAVNSIDKTMKHWSAAYGAKEVRERKTFAQIGQTSTLVQIGETCFELMEPYGEEGVVPKFLKTHGEGFHHLSWLSNDLAADCEQLEAAGVKVLGKGQPVVFTHPKTTDGVVFEITEIED